MPGALVALLLAGALLVTARALPHLPAVFGHRRAFSVPALLRKLTRDPVDWSGQTVLIQGWAAKYRTWDAPDSIVTTVELRDAAAPVGAPGLPLVWGSGDPLLVSLRRIPLLGRFAPPAQAIRWGARATYRVQLRIVPAAACAALPCVEAIVLDAAPDPGL
jgi:hypothetical protein